MTQSIAIDQIGDSLSDWEPASAKINLTLKVVGIAPNGYHCLDSLVVFTNLGDRLRLVAPPQPLLTSKDWQNIALELSGTYGAQLASLATQENFVIRAIEAIFDWLNQPQFTKASPSSSTVSKSFYHLQNLPEGANESNQSSQLNRPNRLNPDEVTGQLKLLLEKSLPLASGLGGGSADGAAAMRLINRKLKLAMPLAVLKQIGMKIGADFPACLESRSLRLQQLGEKLTPFSCPPLSMVLVNPNRCLETLRVFQGWRNLWQEAGAASLDLAAVEAANNDLLQRRIDLESLCAHIRREGNDLLPAAHKLVPEIGDCLTALGQQHGILAASMSGSGASCFGIFSDEPAATAAAATIAKNQKGWWVKKTVSLIPD